MYIDTNVAKVVVVNMQRGKTFIPPYRLFELKPSSIDDENRIFMVRRSYNPQDENEETPHVSKPNAHMLKQPLLKFDMVWRKFAGTKRFQP
uniref:Uncharacterized protein n=1 Tax=Acrobeloides nanus TaxID=290746 RepID=A0A914D7W9_9BILA